MPYLAYGPGDGVADGVGDELADELADRAGYRLGDGPEVLSVRAAMDIGLALGGGGARCFAQIGALRALEEAGYRAAAIGGCSTAAFIGALAAAGLEAEQIQAIAREADYSSFLNLRGRAGLMNQEPIRDLLRPHLPATFAGLKVPFAVAAVDIQEGELVTLDEGELLPAVCASNAFPGLFSPVRIGGRDLIDGGVLNLVPADLVRARTSAPVIAVDVSLSEKRKIDLHARRSLWQRVSTPFRKGRLPLFLDLLDKAYVITQNHVTRRRYADCPPDLIVKPVLDDDFRIQDFGRLDEAVAAGYEAMVAALARAPWAEGVKAVGFGRSEAGAGER